MKKLVLFFIKVYQYSVSPFLPKACRYFPSCSEFAIQCFENENFLKASFLVSKRILTCNPFFIGGVDLPPGRRHKNHNFN